MPEPIILLKKNPANIGFASKAKHQLSGEKQHYHRNRRSFTQIPQHRRTIQLLPVQKLTRQRCRREENDLNCIDTFVPQRHDQG